MLKRFQRNNATNRLFEEKLYEQVLIEMDNGNIRAGLWAKSLANGAGNEEKAKGLYIKYRVQSIRDELIVIDEYLEIEGKKKAALYHTQNNSKKIETNTKVQPTKKSRKIDEEYWKML